MLFFQTYSTALGRFSPLLRMYGRCVPRRAYDDKLCLSNALIKLTMGTFSSLTREALSQMSPVQKKCAIWNTLKSTQNVKRFHEVPKSSLFLHQHPVLYSSDLFLERGLDGGRAYQISGAPLYQSNIITTFKTKAALNILKTSTAF